MKHIKPLEDIARTQTERGSEFKELCYLLTCKSVTEADGVLFRSLSSSSSHSGSMTHCWLSDWKHFYHQRELLADRLLLSLHSILREECCFYDLSQPTYSTITSQDNFIQCATAPRGSRLVKLLKQSYAYQIDQSQAPLAQMRTASEAPGRATAVTEEPVGDSSVVSSAAVRDEERANDEEKTGTGSGIVLMDMKPPFPLPTPSAPLSSFSPVVKRVIYDYQPSLYPSSIYAVLSIQGSTLTPPAPSAPGEGGKRTKSMSLSYLQQQIEPKITCLALLPSLRACYPSFSSSSSSSQESGLLVFGGLDTGELIEWICYPSSSSSSSAPTKGSQDTAKDTNTLRPSFIQTVYSLPGLSSDDMKIYSDQTFTFLPAASSSSSSFLSSHGNPTANDVSTTGTRSTAREVYLKKHKKLFANKKIRDLVTSCSTSAVITTESTLIALAVSDGGINLMKARPRAHEPSSESASSGGSSRECHWYEHLGRVNVHEGDAYTIAIDPLSSYLASGGFDCSVSVLDIATLTVIRRYKEHQASITQVGCNRSILSVSLCLSHSDSRIGNLVYSASRDGSVKFWDILSGL
jgi:hypothetical protein